jgi:hypothetical protein
MRLLRAVAGSLIGMLSLTQGCTDSTGPSLEPSVQQAPPDASAATQDFDHMKPLHRYSITVTPEVLSRAGAASRFNIHVVANYSSPTTRIDIVFPELARAKLPITTPADNQELPASASVQSVLGRGARLTIPAAAEVPTSGLYRIAVTARDDRDTTELLDGQPISQLEYVEAWIYVDEHGAAFADSLSDALIPDTVLVAPGPRMLRHQPRQASSSLAPNRALKRPGPGLELDRLFGDCDQFHFVYYNGNTLSYLPAAGLSVQGDVTDDWTGQVVQSINTATDQFGDFYVCTGPGTGYSGHVNLQGNGLKFETPLVDGSFGGGESNGYYTELHATQSADTWLFLNLSTTKQTSLTRFGYSRPELKVTVSTNASSTIRYNSGEDRVYLDRTSGFDPYYGWFAPAHEHGHAYHEKALGGIPSVTNCNPHYLSGASSLSCAYVEGWADFFAGFVRGDLLVATDGSDYKFEHNSYYTASADGSKIEGPVAAFFYDLVDGSSSPDGITNGTDGDDDAINYVASYLAQIVKTCTVRNGLTWIRPNGVDHVIYCMERTIDPTITGSSTYFPTRSPDPSDFAESATEPTGWSQSAIRILWKHNLYGE